MDCEAFQEELPDLVYGELPPERQAAAAAHAAECAACADLLAEVRAVREAVPAPLPPVQLGARLKLLARDHLLEREAPLPPDRRGGPLHLALVAVLGMVLVGFGLGVAYERQRGPSAATPRPTIPFLEPPAGPEDLPRDPPRPSGSAIPPRAGPAWQRVLYDAALERQASERLAEAEQYFRRAAAVAPRGPLAGSARLGLVEVLLRQERRTEARSELEQLRRELQAGLIPGGAPLLQRAAELANELGG